MKLPQNFDRRNVLKIIGAGFVGGSMLSGSATAATGEENISLKGGSFHPKNASVSLTGHTADVTWTNNEPWSIPHDINLPEGSWDGDLSSMTHDVADGEDEENDELNSDTLKPGETYTVTFTQGTFDANTSASEPYTGGDGSFSMGSGDDLKLEETGNNQYAKEDLDGDGKEDDNSGDESGEILYLTGVFVGSDDSETLPVQCDYHHNMKGTLTIKE